MKNRTNFILILLFLTSCMPTTQIQAPLPPTNTAQPIQVINTSTPAPVPYPTIITPTNINSIVMRDSYNNIQTINFSDNSTLQITNDAYVMDSTHHHTYYGPKWSPDNSMIGFCESIIDGDKEEGSLIIVNSSNGAVIHKISNVSCPFDWHPNSSTVIFADFQPLYEQQTKNSKYEIWEYDLISNDKSVLIKNDTDKIFENPVYSPNGDYVSFWKREAGNEPHLTKVTLMIWNDRNRELSPFIPRDKASSVGIGSYYYYDWFSEEKIIYDEHLYYTSNDYGHIFITDVRSLETTPVNSSSLDLFHPLISTTGQIIAMGTNEELIFADTNNNETRTFNVIPEESKTAARLPRDVVPVAIDFSPDGKLLLYEILGSCGIINIFDGTNYYLENGGCANYDITADWSNPIDDHVNTDNGMLDHITPVKQRLDKPVILNNDSEDFGIHDCSIATVTMALLYYQNIGVIDKTIDVSYEHLIPILRGDIPADKDMSPDISTVENIAGNKLDLNVNYISKDKFWNALVSNIDSGDPIFMVVKYGDRLAAGKNIFAHAILLIGYTENNEVIYIDPWTGKQYTQSLDDFFNAAIFPDKPPDQQLSFVTFTRIK